MNRSIPVSEVQGTLSLEHIRSAIRILEAHNIPKTSSGHYVMAIHPTVLNGMVMLSIEENVADKWAARERELRESVR